MAALRRLPRLTRVAAAAAATGCIVLVTSSTAYGGPTPTSFTPGDLVVYETLGQSTAGTAVSLVDYGTNGTPSGYAVNLPTTSSGSTTHALVESGSALNDGELTLSADGNQLIATGYNAPVGTAGITGAASTPRTVALVSATGVVDTSTSLTDSTAEGNNFRSATTAGTGGSIYLGSGGGPGIVSDGGTTGSYFNTDKVHEVQVVNGQLYESTTKGVNAVGTGLPTSGTQTDTALVTEGVNGLSSNFGPDQFALVNLSGGTTPNTLYVADGSNGATTTENYIDKFSLEGSSWVLTGQVTVPQAAGLVASVYNGVAQIYATGSTSFSETGGTGSAPGNNTVLYGLTDSSGYEGTLSATPNILATAPSGDDFHGLAFAPGTTTALPNSGDLPEAAYAILLPGLGLVLLGGT
jgi:hypothetical protein